MPPFMRVHRTRFTVPLQLMLLLLLLLVPLLPASVYVCPFLPDSVCFFLVLSSARWLAS